LAEEDYMADIPAGYQRLEKSERYRSPDARFLGPADPNESFEVTIVLRRRPDGEKPPDFNDFAKEKMFSRKRPSAEEFAEKYGAAPEELERVAAFARAQGLRVVATNAAHRTAVVSGTAAQMSRAFAVDLGRYERTGRHGRFAKPVTETYRGREGYVSVPEEIAPLVVGVFGLDNRNITKRSLTGDPPGTTTVTVPEVRSLYNFPTNSAAGETIAIFSEGGYALSDIEKYFSNLGMPTPTITDIAVDASNGSADIETTQDICIAGSAAPGAAIAVYFTTYDQKGWVDLINRVVSPEPGDPNCSVLSNSFYVSNGDDAATLAAEGISVAWIEAVSAAFQDAATMGVTICIASGDTGAQSKVGDGKAHVQYPVSDPWVLGCGGTTVGAISGDSFEEYVWNDTFVIGSFTSTGATGGGVSDYFPLPSYQSSAGVPVSLNTGNRGRGVPDVAADASPNSGYYPIYCENASLFGYPNPFAGNGTSASAPLNAGLIAVLNAALGARIGYLNPTLYALGNTVVRDIFGPPGPANNSLGGVTGYPAGHGWNACTGWGVINGQELLSALKGFGTLWESFGAPTPGVLGAPVVGQNADKRLEVFAATKDGGLWHKWETSPSGPWSQWVALVGTQPLASGPPQVVSNADGRLEVFGMQSGGVLWHTWQTAPNNGWSAGATLGSPGAGIIGGVRVGRNQDGRLEAFGVGEDGQLHHIWQTAPNNGWSGWDSLGAPAPGLSIGDPRVISNQDGRLEVFVLANDQAVWHIWQTAPNSGWSGWASLGSPAVQIANGAPFPGRNADGRLEVFATGADGNVYHIWQTSPGNGWSAWAEMTHLAAIQLSGLGAISNNENGAFQLFTIGSDGALWTIAQTAPSNGWGNWQFLGEAPPAKQLNGDQIPAVGLNSNGLLAIFVLGADGNVWTLSQ
jgi:kumamolisin